MNFSRGRASFKDTLLSLDDIFTLREAQYLFTRPGKDWEGTWFGGEDRDAPARDPSKSIKDSNEGSMMC